MRLDQLDDRINKAVKRRQMEKQSQPAVRLIRSEGIKY